MAVASQFSLEEENFYKDIQDLVKKGNQNEKELSTFLQRYMDLLGRADLDDETFIINFTKAAYIIEASAKVYGTKVDRLWITLERVLESLKVKAQNQKKKKSDDEDGELVDDAEGDGPGGGDEEDLQKKLPSGRKRKKVGEALSSPEDFVYIDIISGLGKSMNDTKEASNSIKFYEKIPNLFIKNKSERKRIDVCLIKTSDDRDESRLRDWIISPDHMLVKEMYISSNLNDSSIFNFSDAINETFRGDDNLDTTTTADDDNNQNAMEVNTPPSPYPQNTSLNPLSLEIPAEGLQIQSQPSEDNNNENIPDLDLSAAFEKDNGDKSLTIHRDMITANLSQEVDLNREANIRPRNEECLVDVNEMFWNPTKFDDVIPSKKLRSGKTLKRPCQLCVDKRKHKKRGKKCVEGDKTDSLDSYFEPLVEPVIKDPLCGYLPHEEFYSLFKIEKNLIDQLGRIDNYKNINEAFHPNESPEDLMNFAGFVGFENYLMTKRPEYEDEELAEELLTADNLDDLPDHDDPVEEEDQNRDFDVPLPVTDYNVPCRDLSQIEVKDADELEKSRLEYQRIVLKETQGAKSSFEKNKELGMRISQWHSSLVDKINLSHKRGALNMNVLASKIMDSFPQPKNGEKPMITFKDMVKNQDRKDVPRYFLACLQLTNEGNIDIHKLDPSPLAVDCMALTKLRGARIRTELDEYTPHNNSKTSTSPSKSPAKRKRDLLSLSSDSEDEHLKISKKSKVTQKSRKRQNSTSENPTSKYKKKQKNA